MDEAIEKRVKKLEEQFEKMRDVNGDLKTNVEVIRAQFCTVVAGISELKEQIKTDISELKEQVNNLSKLPAKRWETVITAIIVGAVSAVVSAGMAIILIGR